MGCPWLRKWIAWALHFNIYPSGSRKYFKNIHAQHQCTSGPTDVALWISSQSTELSKAALGHRTGKSRAQGAKSRVSAPT